MRHLQTFRIIEAIARAGSMRRAAQDMNITASALVRRVQRFEEEFGTELFERLPGGVRLNPAGELVLHHYRLTLSDLSRVQGQVADLTGERRGHVSIACSQALLPYFLPRQIAGYRAEHPGVTFTVNVRDRAQAEQELASYSSDLALVFEPVYLVDFQVIETIPQAVNVVMRADHPLASQPELRLRDCLDAAHIAPSAKYGVRHLLDFAARRASRRVYKYSALSSRPRPGGWAGNIIVPGNGSPADHGLSLRLRHGTGDDQLGAPPRPQTARMDG